MSNAKGDDQLARLVVEDEIDNRRWTTRQPRMKSEPTTTMITVETRIVKNDRRRCTERVLCMCSGRANERASDDDDEQKLRTAGDF